MAKSQKNTTDQSTEETSAEAQVLTAMESTPSVSSTPTSTPTPTASPVAVTPTPTPTVTSSTVPITPTPTPAVTSSPVQATPTPSPTVTSSPAPTSGSLRTVVLQTTNPLKGSVSFDGTYYVPGIGRGLPNGSTFKIYAKPIGGGLFGGWNISSPSDVSLNSQSQQTDATLIGSGTNPVTLTAVFY